MTDSVRHVCGISGGKDSSALAVFLRDEVPDMEYFFCDTGAELPETYEYLTRLEVVLGKPIERLNADRGFDHWFEMFRGALPSPQMRWCTNYMKIKPLEDWIGDTPTISYVAIRADEASRKGYISTKPNIETRFPIHRRRHRPRRRHEDPRTTPALAFRTTTSGAHGPAATSASSSARPNGSASPTDTPTCSSAPSPSSRRSSKTPELTATPTSPTKP